MHFFLYQYHKNLLPSSFDNFFHSVSSIYQYKTRIAPRSTYYINSVKTNYGKFNIRFAVVKVCNVLDENIRYLPLEMFKNEVKLDILQKYCQH